MADFNAVLFDLDGTITDPALGITNSVMYALKKHGYAVPERKELYFFIGPPLADSFMKYCSISRDKANEMVATYREYFADKGLFENELIPHTKELLGALRENNITVGLATSKPLVFAEKILEYFDIESFFDIKVGSNLDGSLTNKAEVIAEALRRLPGCDKAKTAMVGDRRYDIIGANHNGIVPIGVLCGYGDEKELKAAGAEYIAKDLKELKKLIV